MKFLFLLTTPLFLLSSPQKALASFYDTKVEGALLYDLFAKEGVPPEALQQTFEFLDLNEGKTLQVREDRKMITKTINKKNYVVIVDFSKPSSERRLYLMNLKTGQVTKYYVAHGVTTGLEDASNFSNIPDSRQSSLGFYLTGAEYEGSHGESLHLYGLQKTNDRAFERDIVMHGAPYVSMDFLSKYNRMGRSWGCLAVSEAIIQKLIPILKEGSVIYAYHKNLMPMTKTSPTIQSVSRNQERTATHGQDIVPEEIEP
jgi:hypothetical protein